MLNCTWNCSHDFHLLFFSPPCINAIVIREIFAEFFINKLEQWFNVRNWHQHSLTPGIPAFYDHETVIEQKPGAAFRARNIACTLEKESASLSCDLSGAYGDPRIRRVMRKSTLYKNALCYAVIEDQYDTDLACVLSLITAEEPAIQKDASGDFVIRIGELATVCVSGASHVRAERLPIQDPRLQKAWKHDCFRILLETAAKQLTLKFT